MMSGRVINVDDYPEHLNPFDENYDPEADPKASDSKLKYNTWSSSRQHQLVAKQQTSTFLEKPWAALKISPKGKLVRRLSVLKTAVGRFASKKKKQLDYSGSYKEPKMPPRSNSLNADFNFKIISPKLKEKIRQQAFSRSISNQEQEETNQTNSGNTTPQLNGRLDLSLKLDLEDPVKSVSENCSPTSPESEKDISQLGARPKTRKKRPPPPPPTEAPKQVNSQVSNGQERSDDSISANSSITQDLEKDASTDDDNSLTETTSAIGQQRQKQERKND